MSKILAIADLHVGSKYALMQDKFENVSSTKMQRKIFERWVQMTKLQRHIEYLIIDGDIVDGPERLCNGKELWTSDLDTQINAAMELVKMIDYDKLLVAYGSPYHTGENLNGDQVFAKEMNASNHDYELSFQPQGTTDIIHISHMIGVSAASWQYRTTPLAKELVAALLNEHALYNYKCVIRAHAHYYCYVEFSSFGFITPCWQGRTPYMIRKGLSMVPKLGYVVLTVGNHIESVDATTFDMPKGELTQI